MPACGDLNPACWQMSSAERKRAKRMYIISYDITSNKIRRKIAKELENYGVRVQYSVFECDLDKARYKEIYAKLLRLMDGVEEGSIRCYEICQNCQKRIRVIGVEKPLNKYRGEKVIVI